MIRNEKIKSYRYLLGEITHDKARLRQLQLQSEKGEESLRPLIFEYSNRIYEKKERSVRFALEICEYIEHCPNAQIRDILALRYIDGYSWCKVAYNIGGGNTADGVRKAASRYIDRNPL